MTARRRRARTTWHLVVCWALFCAVMPGCKPTPWSGFTADTKPNVLLITLCSLRADRVSAYGYDRSTTPALDALAKRGVRFTNAYANSNWTVPSHATLLTGLYPSGHGVVHTDASLSSSIAILPEVLTHYGYKTAVHAAIPSPISFGPSQNLWRGFQITSSTPSKDAAWDPAEFMGWLTADESPFFAVIHLRQAHYPYTDGAPFTDAPDPRVSAWMNATHGEMRTNANWTFSEQLGTDAQLRENFDALYDAGVRRVDESLAQALQALEETGALENTVVIAVAGHGEALGEDRAFVHEQVLADEVLRIPWILTLPGWDGRSTELDEVVSQVDLLPTIFDLLELPTPAVLDGRSLVPLLRGETIEARPALSQNAEFKGTAAGTWREVVSTRNHRYESHPVQRPETPNGPALFRRGAEGLERVSSPTPEEQAAIASWRALIDANQPTERTAPNTLTPQQRKLRAAQGYW